MENISIAITTRNRPECLEMCLRAWGEYYPSIKVIIVDDGSDPSYCDADYRFSERVGISRAKNKCIELAMNTSAEHIFLVDDDTYPIAPGGLEKYIESPYKHMCYSFTPVVGRVNGEYKKHNLGNGCLMYMHRSVFEQIGGFDTTFFATCEHNQFSYRCFYADLIPNPYIDFKGSSDYFHCLDQDKGHERTMSEEERKRYKREYKKYFSESLANTEFVSYL